MKFSVEMFLREILLQDQEKIHHQELKTEQIVQIQHQEMKIETKTEETK